MFLHEVLLLCKQMCMIAIYLFSYIEPTQLFFLIHLKMVRMIILLINLYSSLPYSNDVARKFPMNE